MNACSRLFDCHEVRLTLPNAGFARFTALPLPHLSHAASELQHHFKALPVDPHEKRKCRQRSYQKFEIHGWDRSLHVVPRSTYFQELEFNPQDGGKPRKFAPLGNAAWNPFLHEYILEVFACLPLPQELETRSWDIGVHLIRMIAREGVPAVASPNQLHRDGEPFTAICVLGREHVIGGRTIVAKDPHGEVILEDCVLGLFETALVVDSAVWHHITPVEVEPGFDEGYRDVLLVEFTPFRPDFRPLVLNSI